MTNTSGNQGGLLVSKSVLPGVVGITQAQNYFVREMAFTGSNRYSFAADETKHFLIDPTSYTPDSEQEFGKIIIEVPSFFAASGPLEVNFYRAPTVAPATPATLSPGGFNRVAGSARTPQLDISLLDQAPGSLGTLFSEILIPSNATGAGQQVGFSVEEVLPFELDITATLLMTVHNLDGADTKCGIRWNWFEI